MAAFLIIVGLIILVLYFLNQNKSQKKDVTTIIHKQVIQTKDGEVRIERRQTLDSVQTSYTKKDIAQNQIQDIKQNELPVTSDIELTNNQNNNTVIPSLEPVKNQIEQQSKTMTNDQMSLDLNDKQQELDFLAPINDTKSCLKCEKNLATDLFGKSQKNPDGLTKWCLNCLNNANKQPSPKANQKYCPKCRKNRLKTSFNKNSNRVDGLTKWCKDCMR
ncbi:hypothetical protein [Acinetobacter pollinis]|uniref:Uncharacterized protein n=1 Tax=Acinetobacter pollinis TaxID=2605270 RepID=A0ABU6DVV5_9GAMM|nr:hypothetical protein [Acinetobacter pollinis]MEB5477289.1 hypothetical protein [Acinetobacter pollinis]